MAISKVDSPLFGSLFSDPQVAQEFSDARFIQRCVEVEAALARVQAKLGVIPAEAGEQIAAASLSFQPDMERLQAGVEKAGFPIIELVKQLRAHVGGDTETYVHWGATTQDIMDTALVLQIRAVLEAMENTLVRLIKALARLADQHRATLMAGRTHSQQAVPIPFGFKVAGWCAPLLRDQQRLAEIKPRLLVVEFGGAAGTLASLGERGIEVQNALADELGLGVPLMTWHTQRDSLVEIAGWLSLVSGSLAKMAQDILLLAQTRDRRGARIGGSFARRIERHAAEKQPDCQRIDPRGGAHQCRAAFGAASGAGAGAGARDARLAGRMADAAADVRAERRGAQ